MGVAAVRSAPQAACRRRPHLAVVPPARTRPAKRKSAAAQAAAARHLFTVFATAVVIVSLLGMGRVWLSVQAAEASIKANELRSHIKTERYQGDMLEVRQSALGSPSRIRAIAGTAMQMTSSRKVTYLRLDESPEAAVSKTGTSTRRAAARGTLSHMMDLTAGEAQVLLVGSIGLGRSK